MDSPAKAGPSCNYESKTFCALAWNHFYTNPDGTYRPCCIYGEDVTDEAGRSLNMQTHSVKEIWNAPAVREIRKRMAEGKGLKGCAACYHGEKFGGGQSYRTWANQQFLVHQPNHKEFRAVIDEATRNDQFVTAKPAFFDVRLGNLCNLKCRSCSPTFSSSIERDPAHAKYHVRLPILNARFPAGEPWFESDVLRDELYDMSDNIDILTLAGGEPTINKIQMGWLEHLIETGRAPRVTCTVWTNFTGLNPRFYELMKKFGQFILMMSIDGFGKEYEYLRFPGKWSAIEQNVQTLRLRVANPTVNVIPVVQLCNAMDLTDIFAWAHGNNFNVTLNKLTRPAYLSFNLLPPAARDVAVARLAEYVGRAAIKERYPALVTEVTALIEELNALPGEPTAAQRAEVATFRRFTADLDATRNQDFRATFPELAGHLDEFYGPADLTAAPAAVTA